MAVGRYMIEQPYASGAQSQIYRAFDTLTQHPCLLKTGPFVEREAFLSRELNHPYISKPYDFGKGNGLGTFAVYEEIHDSDLTGLKDCGQDEIRKVTLRIAEFLSYIHHRGWLYNDFKPQHFLFSEDAVRVVDLGLCSSLNDSNSGSSTYSGTFPFISPERMVGLPFDQRSDIFSFGMLLLNLFLPSEELPLDPSIQTLDQFRNRVKHLKGFWKHLISEMTAWEPAQRIGSAEELWNRLLPDAAKKSFLFFPIQNCLSLPSELFGSDRVVFFQSPSEITLSQGENQAILAAWRIGCSTLAFNMRENSLEEALISICQCLSDETPADPYSAIDLLQKTRPPAEILILFSGVESLNRKSRSLMAFALTTLSSCDSLRFLISSTISLREAMEEGWKRVEELVARTHDDLVKEIFPEGSNRETVHRLSDSRVAWPEQILGDLLSKLPSEARFAWPGAVQGIVQSIRLEKLTALEKRILAAIAISGGLVKKSDIRILARNAVSGISEELKKLVTSGCLKPRGECVALQIPASTVLDTFRKEQIRELAKILLLSAGRNRDFERLYFLALAAGDQKTASSYALRLAKKAHHSRQRTGMFLWLFRAMDCGRNFSKTWMVRMARHFLVRSEMTKVKQIFHRMKRLHGDSLRLADLRLDYYFRRDMLDEGLRLCESVIRVSEQKQSKNLNCYFSLRMAGLLLTKGKLAEAETILNLEKKAAKKSPSNHGLWNHCSGLAELHRGRLIDAASCFLVSTQKKHLFSDSSWMNLGIVQARQGDFESAEKSIRHAIRMFSQREDSDCLCHAYNNLGILLKQKGQIQEARSYYYRSLHLSRISGNTRMSIAAFNNIASTYSVEGRANRSLFFYRKSARLADRKGFQTLGSYAMTSAGSVLAMQGKFQEAIFLLRKAAKIRQENQMWIDLASTLEALGVACLLSRRYYYSRRSLLESIRLFHDAHAILDEARSRIYLGLAMLRAGKQDEIPEILKPLPKLQPGSFELGLLSYLQAESLLRARNLDRVLFRDAIHSAEVIFRSISSLYWLGKAYELKAMYLRTIDRREKALVVVKAACDIFIRLNARREILNLTGGEGIMGLRDDIVEKMAEKLPYKVLGMVREVLGEKNPEEMVSKILTAALDFTDMERAVLILQDEPPKIFKSTTLDEKSIQEICEISQSAAKSTKSGTPLVCFDAMSDPSFSKRPSILANQIMSIICLPLVSQEQTIGYLYLDSREAVETLAATEKVLLEIFASIISLALSTSLILDQSKKENDAFRATLGFMEEFPQIVGTSKPMMDSLKMVHRLMDTELPVLITGETGTGKELIARLLHFCGKRKNGPFVAVNCSALTESLLESELFGHEKGSFTGASITRKGLFEEARNGTLFLDEIGDMPLPMQAKFLRVLQDGEFRRVGGNQMLRTNARIVLATNRNLQILVQEKQFREDLFYRVKVAQIHLPPLRERKEDILLIATFFLKAASAAARKKVRGFGPEASELIRRFHWPGNVRQLKNEIERIVALTDHDWIQPDDFEKSIEDSIKVLPSETDNQTLREIEKSFILERLRSCQWNIVHAAKSLGLTRNGLYSKMRIYGIPKKQI